LLFVGVEDLFEDNTSTCSGESLDEDMELISKIW
jgi:hypothetical protein